MPNISHLLCNKELLNSFRYVDLRQLQGQLHMFLFVSLRSGLSLSLGAGTNAPQSGCFRQFEVAVVRFRLCAYYIQV